MNNISEAVFTKSKTAFKSLSNIIPLFYAEGRQLLIAKLRSTACSQELDVKQKKLNLVFDKINNVIELVQKIEKIKDQVIRAKIRDDLLLNMNAFGIESPFPPRPDMIEEIENSGINEIMRKTLSSSSLEIQPLSLPLLDNKKK
ncbi:hypothetical protein SBDP1_40005 [Syntrophobacter sp. SbD1]|nr:hypothetical protein SBDP1_40005 [Syntrophobacter sp. SbD1]